MYVQFSDFTETTIIAVFSGPQNATAFPNQGTVTASDARWAAFYATQPAWAQTALLQPTTPLAPSLAQQASNLIPQGLTITSQSASGLNGLYGIDSSAQQNILAIQVYLQNNGKFPGSSGSLVWLDKNNLPHTFTATGQFTEFATAVADYVSDLTLISMTGSGSLPQPTTTIA